MKIIEDVSFVTCIMVTAAVVFCAGVSYTNACWEKHLVQSGVGHYNSETAKFELNKLESK